MCLLGLQFLESYGSVGIFIAFFRKMIFQILFEGKSWKKKFVWNLQCSEIRKEGCGFFFLGISRLWNQQASVWGHLFLMTFEYLKSIVVDFVFSVSPLYNSNTPTDSSRGPAGLSQFQNSVYFYLSTQKQIHRVYLSCGQWAYTNLRHGFWVWFLVPSAQMHGTMISPLINVICLG